MLGGRLNSAAARQAAIGVASSGGHLVQLEALVTMGLHLDYILSPSALKVDVQSITIRDCNINQPVNVLRSLISIARVLWRIRPAVVITTGAAPGGIALVVARFLGAKTIWIDSIANVNKASLTGRLVRPFATTWVSQWECVAKENKGVYIGKIFNFFDSRNSASI